MSEKNFECPAWLDEEAKTEWKRIVEELAEKSDLKTIDLKAVEGYVQSYSKWKACEIILREKGYVMEMKSGYCQQRPEVAISKQALADMRAFQKELGLTPAARSRMSKNGENIVSEDIDEEMEAMISK